MCISGPSKLKSGSFTVTGMSALLGFTEIFGVATSPLSSALGGEGSGTRILVSIGLTVGLVAPP